jgi:hypothetical protein
VKHERAGEGEVPLAPYLGGNAFDPDAVKAMTTAFDEARKSLQLVDRHDPLNEMVARKIIELAASGERDPVRLRDLVLTSLGGRTSVEAGDPRL